MSDRQMDLSTGFCQCRGLALKDVSGALKDVSGAFKDVSGEQMFLRKSYADFVLF